MRGEKMQFGQYAQYYDTIYKDKDYDKEVKFLNIIFEKYGKPVNILEVGCGTGNYTKLLLEQGYDITGIDISEKMLKIAKKKCRKGKFHAMDLRQMALNERFDACIGMFAVIGYLTESNEIETAFKKVFTHLKDGGLFVFDIWNGLSVIRILPETRIKKFEDEYLKITRISEPLLRSADHVCDVNYKLFVLHKKNGKYEEIDEEHTVRFFFPKEVEYMLKATGFEVLKICPFLDLNKKIDEYTWNMCVIAKKIRT